MGIENLEKKFSGTGREDEKQKAIGEIRKIDGGIRVETLGGCHKDVLLNTMKEIANETGEVVIADFYDGSYNDYIIVKPENLK